MADPILEFENDCAAAGLQPTAVLSRAGLHRGNWARWKAGESSPTLRNFAACRSALDDMTAASGGEGSNMAPAHGCGAENPERNVSRTNEPGSSPEGATA